METLPVPNSEAVKLVSVSAETVPVLRFSGRYDADVVVSRKAELMNALEDTPWRAESEPVGWFYDPPWTVPFRRNEVAVRVAKR